MAANIPKDIEQLLPEARLWVRKTTTAFDTEISDTILAAIDDMDGAGVILARHRISEGGVRMAIKLYLKANFGFSEDSGKYQERYEKLRDSLACRRRRGVTG